MLNFQKWTKWYSFVAHYEKHFKANTSHADMYMFMKSKLVNNINNIGGIKVFNIIYIYWETFTNSQRSM